MNRNFRPFFIILTFVSCIAYSQEPLEPNHNYDVEHIKIDVKLDLEKKTLDGVVTTSIRSAVDKLDSFKVNAVNMNIKHIKGWVLYATNKPEEAEKYEDIKYRYDGREITVILPQSVKKNFPYKYQVEYSVTNPERGMYFIGPDSLYPDKPLQVWTQGEDMDNRYWLPCYDFPNDKANTETFITIDKQYVTLSNGMLESEKENSDGTKTWHWVLNHPHSSYLIMLTAGNFDIISDAFDSIPVYSYVPSGGKDEAVKSFNLTADMMKFFSDEIGYVYPWQRYSQIVVRDFVYGGMENTSATVLTDVSIFDEKTPPDYNAVGLIAHELAHDWWGDNVTCRNWNEIWLNESFATYYEALYKEYHYGKDEFDYEIYRDGQNAIETDSAVRRPIYTNEALTANSYDKGAVVLNMLRYLMGNDDYRKAMHNYITKNEFKPVVTGDLIREVNEVYNDPLLDRVPNDFTWFFDEWIYKAGQPEYKVNYDYNSASNQVVMTLQQAQKPDSLMRYFKIPVPVEVVTEKSKIEYTVTCDSVPKTYTFSLDAPLKSVIFNKGNKVLSKLYFTKPLADWVWQLQNSEDAIDRISAIKGLNDFINDDDAINALGNLLSTDKFWGVRSEAASVLGNSSKTISILKEHYKTENDSRVRRDILLSLGNEKKKFPDCADTKELSDFIISSIKNESSYYAAADGINALAMFADKDKLYDLISPFEKMESHNDIIKRALAEAYSEIKDTRSIDFLVNCALKGKTLRLKSGSTRALANFMNDKRAVDAMHLLIFSKNRYARASALNAIEKAGDKSAVPYLEKLLSSTKDTRFEGMIKKVLEKLK